MQETETNTALLFEPADCGRILGITSVAVHKTRDLVPVARTPRGTRLYRPEDVERVREKRSRHA